MEVDLGIPTALFAPPVRGSMIELGKSQIGFMNLFALPLFLGVSDILPAMRFSVDEIVSNKNMWEAKIKQEIQREEALKGGHLRAPSTADAQLSPRTRSLSNVPLSPEQHPPALVATSAEMGTSPSQARSSGDPTEMSPRSSLTTLGRLAGSLPESALRSSISEAGQDVTSRRSSGAYPNTTSSPPQLRPRPSSNTIPTSTQLPLEVSTSREDRRSSADHSLVAVLVTSPGKSSKTSSAVAKRHSSEKGSLPSSNEWQSQTSPTTNITYSPTTEATSFLSETSSERGEMNGGMNGGMMGPAETLAPPLVTMGSNDGTENSWTGNSSTTSTNDPMGMGKVIRQRPSRWKLGNFWRNRRKTPSSSGGASASGSSP